MFLRNPHRGVRIIKGNRRSFVFRGELMRASSLAVLYLLAGLPCSATTLVALWTPDRVVLGADSMVVTNGPASYDACKIVHAGGTWLAVSGLVTDEAAGYQLGPLARMALDQPGSMQ